MKIWRMRIACWIPKATNIHSGCVILLYCNGYTYAPQCYILRSLLVLFYLMFWSFSLVLFSTFALSQNIHPVLAFYSTKCVPSSWEMNATGIGCGGCGLDSSGSCYGFHFLVKPKVNWRVCVSYIFFCICSCNFWELVTNHSWFQDGHCYTQALFRARITDVAAPPD